MLGPFFQNFERRTAIMIQTECIPTGEELAFFADMMRTNAETWLSDARTLSFSEEHPR